MNIEALRPVARNLLRTYQVRSSRSADLANALSYGENKEWSDDDILCVEGDSSTNMFVILQGNVRIMRNDVNGIQRELAVLSAPTMVGQMGLVDGSTRSASVLAQGDVLGLSITQEIFNKILAEASAAGSAFRHLLLASMTSQLSTANEKIRNLISDMEKDLEDEREREMAAWRENLKNNTPSSSRESSSERLLEIAGVLDGWKVDSDGIDELDIKFVEDDDMKRTREARQGKR
jgi:CRP-like cAMP-binding protein